MKSELNNPHNYLGKYFGYETFRPLQYEIIENVLNENDCLVLMPTGGGKSLCFQIPALMKEGVAVVISPLIALMKDQVEALKANGIEADFLNSTQNYGEQNEILKKAESGNLKLLYIAPERLLANNDLELIKSLNVSLFAIDESHCISAWGHDFRPEYRKLDILKKTFPDIPVMALTATADKVTRRDICRQLGIPNAREFITSFDRPNISLTVLPGRNRMKQIQDFLKSRPNQSGIIYCLSRKGTESVAEGLVKMGFKADFYHAGCTAEDRSRVQEQFINDDLQIIVATVAFGMGIDKSNVRWVIHYNMPGNVEGFYQEIGRAGRDSAKSDTLLFYSYGDIIQRKRMIDDSEMPEEQKEVLNAKLERMRQYAEAQHCRRKILLSYFNQDLESDCGNCDVCKNPRSGFDGTVLAQKALSAIARAEEKVAMGMLIDILRGSRNQQVLRNNYDKLSTFGVGADLKFEIWADYISQMLNLGVMEIAYDEGHAFKLSEVSWQILKGKRKVELANFISFDERKAIREAESAPAKQQKDFFKNELFEKLRILRKEIADSAGIPPYVLFHDSTLLEMANEKPIMASQMLAVSGVGELKMKKYGFTFLKAIQEYMGELEKSEVPAEIIKEIKPKRVKGQTTTETQLFFNMGMSVEEIAQERNLSVATIAGHLVKLKEDGADIDLRKLTDDWTLDEVKKAIEATRFQSNSPLKVLFDHLGEQIGYDRIRIALAVLGES